MNADLLRLIDAISEAYDTHSVPTPTETYCNLGVQYVLARFGYEKAKGMVANQMVDLFQRSADWGVVGMEAAQALANEGRVVVSGAKGDPHGHVVVVRPGIMEFSGKWKCLAPKVSNIGGRPAALGKSAAWAFEAVPQFWMLKTQGG